MECKQKVLLWLIFLFSSFQFSGKGINYQIVEHIDSLSLLVKKTTSKTEQAELLEEIGYIYENNQNYSKALEHFHKAAGLTDTFQYPNLFVSTQLNIARVLNNPKVFKLDSAYQHIWIAYSQIGNLSNDKKLECLISLTGIHYALYQFEDAIRFCLECIELAKEVNDKSSLQFCYSRMAAYSEIYLRDNEKVKEYSKLSLGLALEDDNEDNNCYYYLIHSYNLNAIEEYEAALSFLDSSEVYLTEEKKPALLSDILSSKGEAYKGLGNFPLAEKYYKEAWEKAKEYDLWNRKMHVPLDLAELALVQQQYTKVIEYASKGLAVSPDKITLYEAEKGNRQLYLAYQKLREYKKALHHFELWDAAKDSMNQTNNISIIAGLENKFKNNEQKKQISYQQKIITQQKESKRIISSLFAVLSLLTMGLVWLVLKMEKSSNEIRNQHKIISKQRDELHKLDKVKSNFFANVSHEFRTPLTLILGPISSVLKAGNLTNRDFTLLIKAQQSGKDLLRLVGSILNLSKMDSGSVKLHESTNLYYPLVRRIVSSFESHAQRKNIHFSFVYDAEKDLQLELDKDKLGIILNNLLSNAMKFTSSGDKITFVTKDLGNTILIMVKDTGRGISEFDLPHVFNRFYQSYYPDSTSEGGTGIGLALSQEFVQLMKGRIWVESELGKGSSFFVEIPRKEVLGVKPVTEQVLENFESVSDLTLIAENIKSQPHSPVAPENAYHILIVEDNHSLRGYLKTVLEPYYKVTTVENGLEALDVLQESTDFQLVLSDIMMPLMDGYQLLNVLKKRNYFHHLPVIMLTARADLKDKLKALRIGVDDYLLKPFEEEELLTRIENLLTNYNNRKELQKLERKTESHSVIISKEDSEWLAQFERYVQTNIENTQLSVPEIAKQFRMSESTLLRQLKRLTGLTPNKYILETRLNEARLLIENKTYNTVAQIAYKVGYKDAKSFTRSFKKRYGKAPSIIMNSEN